MRSRPASAPASPPRRHSQTRLPCERRECRDDVGRPDLMCGGERGGRRSWRAYARRSRTGARTKASCDSQPACRAEAPGGSVAVTKTAAAPRPLDVAAPIASTAPSTVETAAPLRRGNASDARAPPVPRHRTCGPRSGDGRAALPGSIARERRRSLDGSLEGLARNSRRLSKEDRRRRKERLRVLRDGPIRRGGPRLSSGYGADRRRGPYDGAR